MKTDWRSELEKLARSNENYAEFNKKIANTKQEILGVRIPDLRKLAKKIAHELKTFSEFQDFLRAINDEIFEEVFLAGLLISYAELSTDEKIILTREYLPQVDSWAEIDSFVQSLEKEKSRKTNARNHKNDSKINENLREKYWNFALENLKSDKEFFVRYGVMVLFSNFLNQEKIDEVFAQIRQIPAIKNSEKLRGNSAKKIENYYIKMAVAWLYAEAAVNFYEKTLAELNRAEIDNWTRRKALQKMIESRRFTNAQKTEIRKFKETK